MSTHRSNGWRQCTSRLASQTPLIKKKKEEEEEDRLSEVNAADSEQGRGNREEIFVNLADITVKNTKPKWI